MPTTIDTPPIIATEEERQGWRAQWVFHYDLTGLVLDWMVEMTLHEVRHNLTPYWEHYNGELDDEADTSPLEEIMEIHGRNPQLYAQYLEENPSVFEALAGLGDDTLAPSPSETVNNDVTVTVHNRDYDINEDTLVESYGDEMLMFGAQDWAGTRQRSQASGA